MKRILVLISLILCLCAMLFICSCGDNKDTEQTKVENSKPSGGNTPGTDTGDDDNTPVIKKITVTFDGKGGLIGSDATLEQEIDSGTLVQAPVDPIKNGYIFKGWATDESGESYWNFETDKAENSITLYAVWEKKVAEIVSVDGATISGTDILMVVDKETEYVALASKVACKQDCTWKLYYDRLGQMEIPTKMAASLSGSLESGDNLFYILVTVGEEMNVYTLNVHRSYDVTISFYNGQELLNSEIVPSLVEHKIEYVPSIKGYTFNYWANECGEGIENVNLTDNINLYACVTANQYTVSYDENGGDEISTNATVTYDSSFTFDLPNRRGYTFIGWEYNSQMITGADGYFEKWTYDKDAELRAIWEINEYEVVVNTSSSELGSAFGNGIFEYGTSVTVRAEAKEYCDFAGWFDENGEFLSNDLEYTFTLDLGANYTAKFVYGTITLHYVVNGNVIDTEEYTIGQHITELLSYKDENGVFMGWYRNGEFSTRDESVSSTVGLYIDENNNAYVYGGTHTGSDSFEFTYDGGKYLIGLKSGEYSDIVIPSAFNGLSVEIGEGAFLEESSIKTVTIQEGILAIGKNAFFDCTSLTSVEISSTVKTIEDYAFSGCSSLEEIDVPNTVSAIGLGAFGGCTSLAKITLPYVGNSLDKSENSHFGYIFGAFSCEENKISVPTSLKEVIIKNGKGIINGAFLGCASIESIQMPKDITSIGQKAFYLCTSLKNIEIPSEVIIILDEAFYGCASLTSISLPSSIKSLKDGAFENCTSLDSVVILAEIEGISPNTFKGCTSLKSIELSHTIKEIGEGAFYNCSSLTDIDIKESITVIGADAFYGCGFTSISIPSNITSIGLGAFENCPLNEITLSFTGNVLGGVENSHFGYIFGARSYSENKEKVPETLKLVTLTQGETVNEYAFYGCTSITNVKTNGKLSHIGSYAFYDCASLKSIDELLAFSIGEYAFYGCTSLENITLTSSVDSIGLGAFSGCTSLESIALSYVGERANEAEADYFGYIFGAKSYLENASCVPASLKNVKITDAQSIPANAFYGCLGIENVELNYGLTTISENAFFGCSSIKEIKLLIGVQEIGKGAFENCTSLESIELPFVGERRDGVENTHFGYIFGADSYSENADYVPASLKAVTVYDANSLGEKAFMNCRSLKSISVYSRDGKFASMGKNSFGGCSSLENITLPFLGREKDGAENTHFSYVFGASDYRQSSSVVPSSLKTVTILSGGVADNAFHGCNAIENVVLLGEERKEIGTYAFHSCTSLESIELSSSFINIDEYAFYRCTALASIVIPEGVESIAEYAFRGCTSLENVSMPNSITYIGGRAFEGCGGLKYNTYDNALYLGNEHNPYVLLMKATSVDIVDCEIHESTKHINRDAFNGCDSLVTLNIPDSVIGINEYAFENCPSLQFNEYDNGLYLGNEHNPYVVLVMAKDKDITSCKIAPGTKFIYHKAFRDCVNLLEIEIPNSVIRIGYRAFEGCTSLTAAEIGTGIVRMDRYAFNGCKSLTSITLPFVGSDLTGMNAITIGWIFGSSGYDDHSSYVPSSLEKVVITGGEFLGDYAFWGCEIRSIDIPKSVKYIGENAVHRCTLLESINVNSDNEYYMSIDGALYSKDGTALILCAAKREGEEFIVPDGVTSIGDNAFYGCTGLTSISIPNSVTSIGDRAFRYCSSLTSIEIPNSVTSIGYEAFSGCSSLTSIEIPNSVTSIGSDAFYGCTSIESVKIGNGVTSIGSSAFYNCSSLTSIVLPDSVTSIGYRAFSGCIGLTNVVIGNGVTSIDSSAFYNCSSLTSIEIPNSVTSIGSSAFEGCTSIESVKMGNGVTSIGSHAFYNCSSLTSIEIPNSVTSIGDRVFCGCIGLTNVVIGNGVTSIGSYAFEGCTSLESLTIPFVGNALDGASKTHLGYLFGASSYSNNSSYVPSSLKTVVITNAKSIGDYAFYNCSSLTSIVLPDSVTSIGKYAFYNCSSLTSIVLPDSVTSIGYNAFQSCTSLTSIKIPDNVTEIGSSAFYGCTSLESLTVPFVGNTLDGASKTHLGYLFGASSYSNNSSYVPSSLKTVVIRNAKSIDHCAFYNCSSLTSIVLPDSVTSIGGSAFENCSSLTSIVIPDSVTSIGYNAFYGCTYIESLTIPFVGNALDDASKTHLGYWFGAGRYTDNSSYVPASLKTVVITNANSIGNYAFYGCVGLTSISIPNSVTSIGEDAFYGCISLQYNESNGDMYLGNSENPYLVLIKVKDTSISAYEIKNEVRIIYSKAFYKCSNLEAIEIPNNIIGIGYNAFFGCNKLQGVYIEDLKSWCEIGFYDSDSNPLFMAKKLYLNNEILKGDIIIPEGTLSIGDYVFCYCDEITSISIPNSVTSIGNYAFSYCTGLTSIVIGDGVTSIGNGAFSYCTGLTSISIPNSVTSIGNGAFNRCTGLTSIALPNSVTSIGDSAFNSCTGLTSISIPNSVTSIGNGAFDSCSGLTSIALPNSVTSIGDGVFNYCTGLTSIEIPDSVTSIGSYAFRFCSSLTSIEIPDSVTSIGKYAFYNCSGLTSIEIPNSVTSIGGCAFYNCSGLTSVVIPSGITRIEDELFCGCAGLESVSIPEGVTYIGNNAFKGCATLKEMVIPNSLKTMGTNVFGGCTSMSKLTIPFVGESYYANSTGYLGYLFGAGSYSLNRSCVPLSLHSVVLTGGYRIEPRAYYDCSGLVSITIPSCTTAIYNEAFSGCYNLKNVYIEDLDKWWEMEIGDPYANPLTSGARLYLNGELVTELVVPEEVTVVKQRIFSGYSFATSVVLHDGVTSIGDNAFSNCKGLTSIEISNSVTSIGDNAFSGCKGLTSIAIPSSVTSIGEYLFSGCSSLKSVSIPSSIKRISKGMFYGCSGLETMIIPAHITAIDDYAFYGCTSLTYVYIPINVQSIGYAAFLECTKLTIYCAASSKPSGWEEGWNYLTYGSGIIPVRWGQ